MPPNPIPVTRVEQIEDYYCGAAAAAMILCAKGVITEAESLSDETQDDLWAAVMDLTTGPDRPDNSEGSPGYIDEFAGQQCYECVDDYDCWATTPQAMRATLNKHLPAQARYSVTRSSDEHVLTERVLKSIDKGNPAAVAAGASSHWVVAHGYLAAEPELNSVQVGDVDLNGVYVSDPSPGESDLDMVPVESWLDEYVNVVKCGSSQDDSKHVAVVRMSG